MSPTQKVPGVLLVYHRPTLPWQVVDADNVEQNIAAFGRHSSLPLWKVNTDYGFLPRLAGLDFDAVVLHYTVFVPGSPGPSGYLLDEGHLDWLSRSDAYKVATFQDEYHWCRKRFGFIDDFGIDCVYTMLEQPYADEVYKGHSSVSKVVPHLPGYVGEELLGAGKRFGKPDRRAKHRRRATAAVPLPTYMGRARRRRSRSAAASPSAPRAPAWRSTSPPRRTSGSTGTLAQVHRPTPGRRWARVRASPASTSRTRSAPSTNGCRAGGREPSFERA